jgi:hypothetical protein
MKQTDIPSNILSVFANSATTGYINSIQQTDPGNGHASFALGFPPVTFQDVAAGGQPPFGSDFNGILNLLSAHDRWVNSGAVYPYDSAFSTAIGGYPKGAKVGNSTGDGTWMSTVDDNTTDPSSDTSGKWVPIDNSGIATVSLSSSNVTLTPSQYQKKVIVLSGTLTANVQVIFPAVFGSWIVENNTSGAFTVTVKTSTGVGTQLVQGASGIVFYDGTDLRRFYLKDADVFSCMEDVRASTTSAPYIKAVSFYQNGQTNEILLYKNSTSGATPTAAGASTIASALAANNFVNAAGNGYSLVIGQNVDPYTFGSLGNNNDDGVFLQAWIDWCTLVRQEIIWIRDRNSTTGLFSTSVNLSLGTTAAVRGIGKGYCGLKCLNCDGFALSAGNSFNKIKGISIVQSVRYTTTANTYVAIKAPGASGSSIQWCTFKDIFVDGFYAVANVSWISSSNFQEILSVYGCHGIIATGDGVNNWVQSCWMGGSNVSGSKGVGLGDGTTAIEGWQIHNNLLSNFAIGVYGTYANNITVEDNIIDFFQLYAVQLANSANGPTTNWTIRDNYMATDSATASAGVRLSNGYSVTAQSRGTLVDNNQILYYSGASLSYGVYQDGAYETRNTISNNRTLATTYDVKVDAGDAHVFSNNASGPGFYFNVLVDITGGNNGTYLSSMVACFERIGKYKRYFNSSATTPAGATPAEGDEMKNIAAIGTGVVPGWIYSSSSSSWHAMAALA